LEDVDAVLDEFFVTMEDGGFHVGRMDEGRMDDGRMDDGRTDG
jgi:uncharacterized protein YdaU (DUF1376 family)